MKERILKFLTRENKSSSQFAEEIGVQPSSISHILSGRNNPSLDFVLKMLARYPGLRTDWLLFGKGGMYSDTSVPTLFGEDEIRSEQDAADDADRVLAGIKEARPQDDEPPLPVAAGEKGELSPGSPGAISRIVIFREDMTFEIYRPG